MKLTEKKFNFYFNIFLVAGMLVAEVCYLSLKGSFDAGNSAELVITMIAMLSAMMGVINCILSANGSIWTFIFGVIQVSLASYINLVNGLTGQFALHAFYYLPMQFVGFWQWRVRGAKTMTTEEERLHGETGQVKARRMSASQRIWLLLVCIAGAALAYAVLYFIDKGAGVEMDKSKIFMDAAVTALSIIAQVLMSFAFMEQWILWNLANLIDVVLWSVILMKPDSESYAVIMLIMWIFYLLNSLNGLRIWLKLSKES